MQKREKNTSSWLKAQDSTSLFLQKWIPSTPPKAVVLIVHGMSEHIDRYDEFAKQLCSAGYAVFAHDQRGHGQTGLKGLPGHFADTNGWHLVVNDIETVRQEISRRFPHRPIFLFAHSMGSFIAQSYLIEHSKNVAGVMLCGSNYREQGFYRIAKIVVRLFALRGGPHGKSDAFHSLVFGSMNKKITPQMTDCDWLSRDPVEVEKYIQDPLCGFKGTNQFWLDYLNGMIHISSRKNLAKIRHDLPVLVVGGEADPVSEGVRLTALCEAFTAAGILETELRLFPGARHELLNETNKAEVVTYLQQWLNQQMDTWTASRQTERPTPALKRVT